MCVCVCTCVCVHVCIAFRKLGDDIDFDTEKVSSSNLSSSWDFNHNVFEYQVQALSVASGVVVKLHITMRRPVIWGSIKLNNCWGLQVNSKERMKVFTLTAGAVQR